MSAAVLPTAPDVVLVSELRDSQQRSDRGAALLLLVRQAQLLQRRLAAGCRYRLDFLRPCVSQLLRLRCCVLLRLHHVCQL